MYSKVISTSLGDIEYSSVGQGIPVLFFHGGHSNCHDTLCFKGFDLEKYNLVTPSRPGYGKTPLGNNKTPKQAAALIFELLEHLSLDQVIVYGVSAGGLTAIEFAGNFRNNTKKLILASAVSKKWLDDNGTTYKTARKIFSPHIQCFIWSMIRFFNRLFPTLIANNFFHNLSKTEIHELKKEDKSELIEALNKYSSKNGFINDIDQKPDQEIIAKIKCPTFIIHSINDNSVPLEHAKYANERIENSRIEILNNEWGHLFWIGTDSKSSIEKTIKFIEE